MLSGIVVALVSLSVAIALLKPVLLNAYGFSLTMQWLDVQQWGLLVFVVAVSVLFSLIPGWIAYRRSLQDGLTVKI